MNSGSPSPLSVDERTRAERISLTRIRAAIPTELTKIQALRSWAALARVVACVAVFPPLLYLIRLEPGPALLWQAPALLTLWVLFGWTLVGLFVLGHDCGHGAFSRRRWVNTVIGHLCMAPLSNGFHTWCVTHDHHHAHTQRRGEEVDWAANLRTEEELAATTWRGEPITRLGYAIPFGVFLWILWNTVRRGLLVHRMLPPERLARERRRLRASNLFTALALAALYGGLIWQFGVWGMVKLYGMPGFVAMLTGSLIITIQHANQHTILYSEAGWTPVRGQLVSTFDVRFPRWLEWLWCNINIHIPHHVTPKIPWYNLQAAAKALKEAHPGYYQEHRFGPHDLSWFRRTPLLTEVREKGYFKLAVGA